MDYELVLELKNAGFPQGGDGYWIDETYRSRDIGHALSIYEPTLSELIEACGDELRGIVHDRAMKNDNNEEWRCDRIEHGSFESYIGPTPEEAVAKLWLAINNKELNHG